MFPRTPNEIPGYATDFRIKYVSSHSEMLETTDVVKFFR